MTGVVTTGGENIPAHDRDGTTCRIYDHMISRLAQCRLTAAGFRALFRLVSAADRNGIVRNPAGMIDPSRSNSRKLVRTLILEGFAKRINQYEIKITCLEFSADCEKTMGVEIYPHEDARGVEIYPHEDIPPAETTQKCDDAIIKRSLYSCDRNHHHPRAHVHARENPKRGGGGISDIFSWKTDNGLYWESILDDYVRAQRGIRNELMFRVYLWQQMHDVQFRSQLEKTVVRDRASRKTRREHRGIQSQNVQETESERKSRSIYDSMTAAEQDEIRKIATDELIAIWGRQKFLEGGKFGENLVLAQVENIIERREGIGRPRDRLLV